MASTTQHEPPAHAGHVPAVASSASLAVGEKEAAGLVGVSVRSLQRLRVDGAGPPYANLGRRVVYPTDTLLAWLRGRTVTSTSATTRLEAGR